MKSDRAPSSPSPSGPKLPTSTTSPVLSTGACFQYLGLALLTWRSLWMFFSWDVMLLFPAWCGLATAVIVRHRPRSLPES